MQTDVLIMKYTIRTRGFASSNATVSSVAVEVAKPILSGIQCGG
jgi:hypothetical protein